MGLRELLILILILAIVGVILRGLYVALRARRGQLRMHLDKNVPQYDPDDLVRSELPNGGARMVERSFAQVLQQNSELTSKERRKTGKADHAIPVLMDTIDDDDEEGVSAPRRSSVASARNAARQKHQRGAPIVQKPVHRPIDRIAAATQNNPIRSAPITMPEARETEQHSDEDYYDDPLDSHVFSAADEADDEAVIRVTEELDDTSDEDDFDDFDDSYDDEDDSDDSPSEQSVDPDDDYEEDEDEEDEDDEDFEDEVDDAEDDDDFEDEVDDAEDDEDFDDEDEEDFEEDFEDDIDDARERPAAYADQDDELYEKKAYDDLASWEEEDDAEDEEVNLDAEEFDSVYSEAGDAQAPLSKQQGSDRYDDNDDDDDDDGWDDDNEAEQEPEAGGPRRWLKWAGSKLSGMGASSEEPVREREFHGNDRTEPVLGLDGFDQDVSPVRTRKAAPAPHKQDKTRQAQLSFEDEQASEEDAVIGASVEDEPEQKTAPVKPPRAEAPKSNAKAAEGTVPQDYSEVMVINVVAKPERELYGVDLLQALLGAGLRFGDMSIFHRHFDQDPSSPVLFSVANMMNPGTFDLNQINDFTTRGVCFFMTLPNVANSMQAFDRMLDAAQQLRIALDGDLKDDNRSVMTAQTIEHYRQRVRDFDLRQLRQPK